MAGFLARVLTPRGIRDYRSDKHPFRDAHIARRELRRDQATALAVQLVSQAGSAALGHAVQATVVSEQRTSTGWQAVLNFPGSSGTTTVNFADGTYTVVDSYGNTIGTGSY